MFNITYINELLNGKLTEDGYNHFLSTISYFVRKFKWPKDIITSSENYNSNFWTSSEVQELAHQFFEWIIIKKKLDYLNKIPDSYIAYYFLQMLISFVANRIKQEQQKQGLSFEKCKVLVLDITKSDYFIEKIDEIDYVYNQLINKNDRMPDHEIHHLINYISKIPLTGKTKHYKPLVKMAIDDIFDIIESPVELKTLIKIVFDLFDQKNFDISEYGNETGSIEFKETNNPKHKIMIKEILTNLTKKDALLFLDYLFNDKSESSLADLSSKYNISKSSLHLKIKMFKNKISSLYSPINEEDGILFMQNIAAALDKLSK